MITEVGHWPVRGICLLLCATLLAGCGPGATTRIIEGTVTRNIFAAILDRIARLDLATAGHMT